MYRVLLQCIECHHFSSISLCMNMLNDHMNDRDGLLLNDHMID